jgi:hypothetical protein
MVLAGALTFMACGVSPASARRHSASFIKMKLWLFTLLMIAICIPLYFYSQKIIFDAEYKAAKSEVLQTWLKENDLTLTGIDFRIEDRTIFMALEGPNPPVGIHTLYDRAIEHAGLKSVDNPFTLNYSWTQKVSGSWPIKSGQIETAAEGDLKQETVLLSTLWEWEFTQYDSERGSRPPDGEAYVLNFDARDKMSVTASCGKKKGTFKLRGRSIDIEMKRLNWFGCRKDENLQVFFGDLLRGSEFFINDGRLQITLTTGSGVMYFKKR